MKTFEFSELGPAARDYFGEHGWIHIKNVFSADEIKQFREAGKEKKAANHKGDLLSFEKTAPVIYDDRVNSVAKLLLDTEKPVYFGDSSCMIGSGDGAGFHKDNADRFTPQAPDWQSPYTILRMGIYMQDHTQHSACLALRDGSHKTIKMNVGKPFHVPTTPGDLVAWSLRTTHSGNANRLRFAPDYFLHLRLYKIVPGFMFLPEEDERMSYFMSFGKERDAHAERFIHYLKTRKYMVEIWQNSQYPEAHLKNAAKVLDVVDVSGEVKDLTLAELNEFHKDLKENA